MAEARELALNCQYIVLVSSREALDSLEEGPDWRQRP